MLQPLINRWYQDTETMEFFEIIDIDDDRIEIQFSNGAISELSLDDWEDLDLVMAEAGPEDDWSLDWDDQEESKTNYRQSDLAHARKGFDEDDEDPFQLLSDEMEDLPEEE
jgi:hypothetical protein